MASLTPVLAVGCLVLALVFIWGAITYRRDETAHTTGWGLGTRYFLVLLRLAIGWHFLIEGLEKLHTPTWSSEVYLRESSGPLAPLFRDLAGDRLEDLLTVRDGGELSPTLKAQWAAYVDAFSDYYQLDKEQRQRAQTVLEQVEKNAETILTSKKKGLEKIGPYPPPIPIELTVPQRLEEYRRLQAQADEAEARLAEHTDTAMERFKTAKANLARWRSALQKDLERLNKDLKRSLEGMLLSEVLARLPEKQQEKIQQAKKKNDTEAAKERKPAEEDWDGEDRTRDKWDAKMLATYRTVLAAVTDGGSKPDAIDAFTRKVYTNVIEGREAKQPAHEPVPVAVSRPIASWQLLDWSDAIVKYGLVAVGVGLLAGLLTRTACLAGAGFLLMFFLAMPPLPGLPPNPRAEGHYLYINKNIIEMLALLALATTRSGRWVGLDGLFQLCPCSRKRTPAEPVTVSGFSEEPRSLTPLPSGEKGEHVAPVSSSPVAQETSHGP